MASVQSLDISGTSAPIGHRRRYTPIRHTNPAARAAFVVCTSTQTECSTDQPPRPTDPRAQSIDRRQSRPNPQLEPR
ncbi:MAG: hypothetical protein R3C68_11880 [Myxococcota bacterium]